MSKKNKIKSILVEDIEKTQTPRQKALSEALIDQFTDDDRHVENNKVVPNVKKEELINPDFDKLFD